MSTILEKIGELLRLKLPERSTMERMTEMEPQEDPSGDMAAVPGEMEQMTGMEPQEHSSSDMAAVPGKMEMIQAQPEERQKRGQGADL